MQQDLADRSRVRGGAKNDDIGPMLDAAERSRITFLHAAVIGLCACGFALDLVELALGSALSALFAAAPYGVAPAKLSWMLTSVYFGAIVGAPTFGWIADKIGPKKVLCVVLLWIGISSLLSAGARTVDELAIVRLFAGVGLGAYPPVMIAYLTDLSPLRRRGTVIFTTCAIAYVGPPLAIFAVRWLTPIVPFGVEGWRWPFLAAGVVALAAGWGFFRAPEAPHWLAATGRIERLRTTVQRIARSGNIGRSSVLEDASSSLAVTRPFPGAMEARAKVIAPRVRLLILSVITFTIPISTVSFPLVTGPILLARHFNLSDTLFYVGLATFGPILGTLIGGLFIDGVGRRTFLMFCAAAMLASVALFFLSEGTVAIAAALVGFSLFTALYMPTMTMYGAEQFEPSIRARATSIAWVANRVAAAFAPALLIPMVHEHASAAVGIVLAASLLLNILVVGLLAPPGIEDRGSTEDREVA